MVAIVRKPRGRCYAWIRCDGCGADALPPVPIDPAGLANEARHLRSVAASARKWYRVGYADGGVGIVCPKCWGSKITMITEGID